MSLQCEFTVNPQPNVTWKKLDEPERQFPTGAQLNLPSTTRFDGGPYQCMVDNQLGSSSSTVAQLSVHCKYISFDIDEYVYFGIEMMGFKVFFNSLLVIRIWFLQQVPLLFCRHRQR